MNGHFDGSGWTKENWTLEFAQFPRLIFDVFTNNDIPRPSGFEFGFSMNEIRGFRAPYLGYNAAMFEVLAENGFHYDTSKAGAMAYWPKRERGVWNFPLAIVDIAGTAKRTISMDYNFYFAQSAANDDSNVENQRLYGNQMLQTYYNYFQSNYNGTRSPIHIGHHFEHWNGGVYWDALKTFARTVCRLPEVKCVTYKELTDFMESRTPEQVTAYSRGDFPKLDPVVIPPVLSRSRGIRLTANIGDIAGEKVTLALGGADADSITSDPTLIIEWKLDAKPVGFGITIPTAEIRARANSKSVLSVAIRLGNMEVLRTTRKVVPTSLSGLILGGIELEDEAIRGDLPGAHAHDSQDSE